jgi:hypothetical protein
MIEKIAIKMCFFLDNEHDGVQLNIFNNNMRISIFTDQKKYGTKTHIAQFIVGKSGKNVTTTRVTLQIHKYQEDRLNMKKIEKHTTGACGIIVHRPSASIPNEFDSTTIAPRSLQNLSRQPC